MWATLAEGWNEIERRYVRDSYRSAISVLGDMESYGYLGIPFGYRHARNRAAYWTRRARQLNIQIASPEERVGYGGYGKEYER